MKKLPDAFKHPESLALAYFEASLLVEHLVALNGDAGLRTLLDGVRRRREGRDAFAKAFGKSVDAVEASFKAFVDRAVRRAEQGDGRSAARRSRPTICPALRPRAAQAPGNFFSQMALGAALVKAATLTARARRSNARRELAPQASGHDSPARAARANGREDRRLRPRAPRTAAAADLRPHQRRRPRGSLPAARPTRRLRRRRDFALRLIADLDPFDAAVHGQLGRGWSRRASCSRR